MADIVMLRIFKPWYHPDWLFRMLPLAKEQAKYLTTLHNMTYSVIKTRKEGYLQKKLNTATVADCKVIGKARRC